MGHLYHFILHMPYKGVGIDNMDATTRGGDDEIAVNEPVHRPVSLAFMCRIETVYDFVTIKSDGHPTAEFDDIGIGSGPQVVAPPVVT